MSDSRVCPRCKIDKPLTEEFWQRNRTKGNGWQVYCKPCKRTINLERYHALPKGKPQDQPTTSKICPRCLVAKPLVPIHWTWNNYGWSSHCRLCTGERIQAYRKDNRLKALEHYSYGPPKCSCCNETEVVFLDIDHIEGGGNKHRSEIGRREFHTWLVKNKFPSGFRVLCRNCNWAFHLLGYCPHHKSTV